MKIGRFERGLLISAAWVLARAVLACGEADVADDAPLRTLSSVELEGLCDEISDAWPSAEQRVECGDGSTISFDRPPASACGDVARSECSATAGDVRACTQAIVDDPCAAFEQRPAACAPLQQPGCAADSRELLPSCPAVDALELASLEGIYELALHTENAAACDVEGRSVLDRDTQRLFAVVAGDFFGSPMGLLQSCDDMMDCRRMVSDFREQNSSASVQVELAPSVTEFSLSILCQGDAPGTLRSGGGSAARGPEGVCEMSIVDTTIARSDDGALRLESRMSNWRKPSEGEACGYYRGEEPSGLPCAELEVYEARFLSPL